MYIHILIHTYIHTPTHTHTHTITYTHTYTHAVQVFSDGTSEEDKIKEQTSQRIRDLGRLLCATELRSAKTYWHVQSNDPAVTRVYPEIYTPKVVGMLWSMLAQEQTWFGYVACLLLILLPILYALL